MSLLCHVLNNRISHDNTSLTQQIANRDLQPQAKKKITVKADMMAALLRRAAIKVINGEFIVYITD